MFAGCSERGAAAAHYCVLLLLLLLPPNGDGVSGRRRRCGESAHIESRERARAGKERERERQEKALAERARAHGGSGGGGQRRPVQASDACATVRASRRLPTAPGRPPPSASTVSAVRRRAAASRALRHGRHARASAALARRRLKARRAGSSAAATMMVRLCSGPARGGKNSPLSMAAAAAAAQASPSRERDRRTDRQAGSLTGGLLHLAPLFRHRPPSSVDKRAPAARAGATRARTFGHTSPPSGWPRFLRRRVQFGKSELLCAARP